MACRDGIGRDFIKRLNADLKNMAIEYKKEFFDRAYTLREAYGRVWKYARRYKFRLFIGIVCGMLTAGTLVPFFQIVQPTLQHVESHDAGVEQCVASGPESASEKAQTKASAKPRNAFEKLHCRPLPN